MAPLAAVVLSGCVGTRAPSIPLFGAYFPAWLACVTVGILGAVVIRVAFVFIGLDDRLPLRLLVYVCLASGLSFATSLLFFGS
ncbi:MAG: YtcA family lipoprotein [Candidatus Kaistia colombiensis]|nr:MAG: YtcA family lipoprotein [Kaistia sp.]